MPVQVYEDSLELHTAILNEDGYSAASWPYPLLKQSGEEEFRKFRVIILENEYLKLTFLPELGGRLWELLDKRCGYAHFGDDKLRCQPYSFYTPQGVGSFNGFRLVEQRQERKNSLGPVDFMINQPDSDEDGAAVILASFGVHSFSIRYSIEPRVAAVRVEVTVQNRTGDTDRYRLSGFDTTLDEHAGVYPEGIVSGMDPSRHVWFTAEPGTFLNHRDCLVESYYLKRVDYSATLGPRQVDQYCFNLQPVFDMASESYVGEAGIGLLNADQIKFCATRPLLGHKLLVQNSHGGTFEAPFDAHPESILTISLGSIPGEVIAARISDPQGSEVATLTVGDRKHIGTNGESDQIEACQNWSPLRLTKLEDHELNRLTSDFTLRVPAYLELAARATERGDYQRADTCYEHALLFNGDDPLAWWAKSVNRRIGNLDNENAERTELLNAHYLSPLEPCLRAEAFLAQPRNHGKDPSPLLASFNDVPENFVEVACQLIQARFYEEAAYFIDEALRHQNLGMLHYLHAYLLTRKGGMEMEVASRCQMALRGKFPPMPYRDLEREILMKLVETHKLPQPIMDWLSDQLSED